MSDNSSKEMIITSELSQKQYIKDLMRYREVFYFLTWRDILVRYKQAFFGAAWAVIRPLLNMMVFTLIFNRVAHFSSGDVSYPLFVLAGMLPWQLFSNSLMDTCLCLVNNTSLISKIYFPRLIIPMAQIAVHLVDFSIGVLMLTFLSCIMGTLNLTTILFLPFFLILALMLCLGSGFWLSAMTVKYRDFRFIVPLFVQLGIFLSPVGYGSFIIPEEWAWLYFLNPVAGIIDGFRWSFFGVSHHYLKISLLMSLVITLSLLITGFLFFKKTESTLVDTI